MENAAILMHSLFIDYLNYNDSINYINSRKYLVNLYEKDDILYKIIIDKLTQKYILNGDSIFDGFISSVKDNKLSIVVNFINKYNVDPSEPKYKFEHSTELDINNIINANYSLYIARKYKSSAVINELLKDNRVIIKHMWI